jgi:hypothetical protein
MPDPTPLPVLPAPAESRPASGLIPRRMANWIAFGIILISLVACTLIALLAIWGSMRPDALWRAMATIAVVLAATGVFSVCNAMLGRGR